MKDEEIIRGRHIDDFREQSDIEKRFREEAGLTDKEIDGLGEGILSLKFHPNDVEWQSYRKIRDAQLIKALSTKLDGRYVLALIDTKEKTPDNVYEPPLDETQELWRDVVEATYNRMKTRGFTHKVVHMFGEKE